MSQTSSVNNSKMDYQVLVDIAVGVAALIAGWVFKIVLSQLNEIKKEHHELTVKQTEDYRKMVDKHVALALTLPEKYVSKSDFNQFAERMNQRFDRIEEKLDDLNSK